MMLPQQKLSKAEKETRDETTGKNNIELTIDYYIGCANWSEQTQEILRLFRAVEGELNTDDYKGITNPFNKQKDDTSPNLYNVELKNFNILKRVVNLMVGEYGRRGHEYVVSTVSPSDEMSYKDGLSLALKNYHAQAIANAMLEVGLNLGQTYREQLPKDEYIAEFKKSFDETRTLSGQEILDYIVYWCDLESKYVDAFWDWIIAGRFFTYKKVNHDDIYFEVVPVWEMFVPHETHSRFVEDYSYAIRKQRLPINKIVDLFRGRISGDQIDKLERTANSGSHDFNTQMTGANGFMQLPTLYTKDYTNSPMNSGNQQGIDLYHVVYTSFRKYGTLTYVDEFGQEREMEVGDDYVLNKAQGDIKIEWDWENIKYEGYRCLDMYFDCKELLESRADLNQNGLQKLPYNGTLMRSSSGGVQSIIKDGIDYQKQVNTLKYQVEKLINKNKDKVIVMPYGLVPRKKGMDTKDMMYHADATSILWVDETAPNAPVAAQMIKTLDMSMGTYIKDTTVLIQSIAQEYWDSIGMNAQRFADIGVSAGKAVTDQAINRSAVITYDIVRQFDKVVEKDYQGFLDLSKLSYINGKKAKYIRTDGSVAFLNLNPDDAVNHTEASYGVFVKDASLMSEAIQSIRGQILGLIQNGGDHSVLGEVWKTNNVDRLTGILAKMDENRKQYEQLTAKQAQDAQAALQEQVNQNDAANREMDKYKIDMAYKAAMDPVVYKIDNENQKEESNTNKEANDTEKQLAQGKLEKDRADIQNKDAQLRLEADVANKELALKNKELDLMGKDLLIKARQSKNNN